MASAASAPSFSRGTRDAQAQLPHIVIFPFMAKSHTIPLTHLAHLLRRRHLATVTFLTTPGNAAFVRAALPSADDGVAVVELPFPDNDITVPGFPRGAECVQALDSLSSFPAFVEAASLLRPRFEEALAAARPPASAVVADAFLHWAQPAAAALGVRTLAFFGANVFAHVIRELCLRNNPAAALRGGATVFTMPEFPDVQFSLADIPLPFNEPDLTVMASIRKMDRKIGRAIAGSHALIVNTFDAMERRYIEHWNRHLGPRAWPVGPLCLARPATPVSGHGGGAPAWMRWLDEKAAAGRAVLYVALGTTAAVPDAQLREVAGGLEQSGLDFLWAVRPVDADLGTGFEDRVRGRGMVVREWVDQFAILRHGGVKGFLSHCGWNSVTESISAGVPLAVWPMGAEQPVNAKLVADELRIGIRVPAKHGMTSTLVESEEIARVAKELMIGEKGAEAARNMAALGSKAREAMDEGGSSWRAVEEMIAGLRQPA
ncbi:hypothetical protein SETIT_2G192900v2 [Setaria italica]|uniref:Glycosyltransferase n=1 Tax=Setaria italica TaxID=4555 RepID=K4A2B3_SETIT|nr:UDP-glycosyltransferase 90A1 [Setaria italica]RCV11527.1 hypothetical protein SETIT_2G192900v2 [Setaria italica]